MKKTVFIGSVLSSKVALETLIETGIEVNLVCSLDERYSKNVSDYYPIHKVAEENKIPYIKFKNINSDEVILAIKEVKPDLYLLLDCLRLFLRIFLS